jgi:hypothetical protein
MPIALFAVDDDGDVYVEPIPVLADLSAADRYEIAAALAFADKHGRVNYHPRIAASDWHPLLKSLSPPEYDALCRIMARPEQCAKVQAILDKAGREAMETLRYRLIHERCSALRGLAR